MIYVIEQNGKPLMPRKRHGKVRWLIKKKRAKVVRRFPFTIKLLYYTGSERVEETVLGIDTARYSVSTKNQVLFEAEKEMRTDIQKQLAERREKRRARRNRKIHKDTILKGGIRKIDGTKVCGAIQCKKLKLVERTNTRLIERRTLIPLHP